MDITNDHGEFVLPHKYRFHVADFSSDLQNALALLPHGEGFRFIDRLESLEPGKAAVGVYQLPESAFFLSGHFPGQPLMPGVLMVEAVAQLAGVAAQSDPEHAPLDALRLTAIKRCKILGTIVPGSTLVIEVTVQGRLGNLILATGQVRLEDGTLLLEAEVALSGESAPQDTI